jgi:LEA14-like dessication related protein
MKKSINYLLIILVLISASSCFSYKEVEIKEVQSVRILCMDENTADVEVALKIINPNKMKITIKDLQLDASINKKYVGKVKFDKKIVLPKKSEKTYLLVVKTELDQVKKLIPSLVFSNQALVNFKGNLRVKARGISKRVNLDHDERISKNQLKSLMVAK